MLLSDFDFPFDPTLIADRPIEPREQARLLVLPRGGGACSHHRVADLPTLLAPGDVVVVNDTKVAAVRLTGRKRPGGGKIELVLVKDLGEDRWEVLLKGKVTAGQVIEFDPHASATVLTRGPSGTVIRITSRSPVRELIGAIGQMPLPPYIKRAPTEADRTWYQTAFARVEGSIAAPTAGLHLTKDLLEALRHRGISTAAVTLHVGPATFRPVMTTTVEEHQMGTEWAELPVDTAEAIGKTKAEGGRVVAVGTTVVRTLESAVRADGTVEPAQGDVSLFITPGYRFRVVDALMTNFHLPRTTLLMLVSAFTGLDRLRQAYQEAIGERYRLYSYGDAMLIL
jgi:S-adenosylmethionine:tRNA ribosyltransferase-isomerase